MSSPNTFRSAHSSLRPGAAVEEIIGNLGTDPCPPSLVSVFASSHYVSALAEICESFTSMLKPDHLIGCTGAAIIADAEEIEDEPCLSLWAAWLPEAQIESAHLQYERTKDGGAFAGWPVGLVGDWPADTTLLALTEPYSFPTDVFLERSNADHAGTEIIGGVASGGMGPGESRLILNGHCVDDGAVVAAIRGAKVTTLVSQGCRPIGEPFVITKAEQNVIFELGGRKALEQLKSIYDRLPNQDKELMRLDIQIGRVVNEYQDSFQYGDFLIRNVTGMDAEESSIQVGDYLRVGQTVQFHVRDAATAHEELMEMLGRCPAGTPPKASLLFTCSGRGTQLFEWPHHDAQAIEAKLGKIPNAGLFCQGEIGPIAGVNFLHGFTASMALFH